MNQFERFSSLIGERAFAKLINSHVLVVGLGGVGGNVVETLVRSGIGYLTIIDDDVFELTNLNRQLLATHSSLNKSKVEVCKNRCLDINPNVKIDQLNLKFTESTQLDFSQFDYVVDAVDDVEAKVGLIKRATRDNVPIISCMGTANKFDPTQLRVSDILHTSVCPLASVMRKKCRALGLNAKCVYSLEKPTKMGNMLCSTAFVPNVAGILLAKTVIEDLIKE